MTRLVRARRDSEEMSDTDSEEMSEQERLVRCLHKVAGAAIIIIITYMYSRCRRSVSSYSSVALLSIVEVASYSYDGYNTNMAAILLHTGSIQTV